MSLLIGVWVGGDEVYAKVMADPRMNQWSAANMPFDGMRMFWGGFKVLLKG